MLEVITELDGETLKMTLKGYINELAQLEPLPLKVCKQIVIDFEGVEMVNSTGISKWINWVNQVSNAHPGIQWNFFKCTKMVMDQINSVVAFKPKNCIIHSLFVPYYSELTDESDFILLKRGQQYKEATDTEKAWIKLPDRGDMLPDIFPEKYFHFLSSGQ